MTSLTPSLRKLRQQACNRKGQQEK